MLKTVRDLWDSLGRVANDNEDSELELQSVKTQNGTTNADDLEGAERPLIASHDHPASPQPTTEVTDRIAVANSKRKVSATRNHIQHKSAPGSPAQGRRTRGKELGILNDYRSSQKYRAKSLNILGILQDQTDRASRFNKVEIVKSLSTQQDDTQIDNLLIGNYMQNLNTQLLVAVEKQNIEEIVRLLGEGANPNATCRLSNVSVCHIAALNGGEALPLLLKAGAKTDRFDNLGRTPLHWAAWAGNATEIANILDFSKDLQSKVCDKDMSSKTDEEVKQLIPTISNMTNAVCDNGVSNVQPTWMDSISHACKDVNEYIPILEPKWTPLHAACYFAWTHCVQLLLAAGSDADVKDLKGYTPLDIAGCAIHSGHKISTKEFTDTIKLLVKAVGRNDEFQTQGMKEFSPLHTAIELGSLEAINVLVEAGVSGSYLNKDGLTPMHLCVKKELKEHLKFLANRDNLHNGSAADYKDKDGFTVLHAAVKSGWKPGVCILLAVGANITVMADNGETALHDAAKLGDLDVLNELLEFAKIRGVVDCLNKNKFTALSIAVMHGHLECVKKLLEDGASIKHTLPRNITVLHIAVEEDHIHILRYFFDSHPTAMKDMIDAQAEFDHNNASPLHLAVKKNRTECVKLLISKKANVNLVIKYFTPLKLAVGNDNLEIANIILKFDKSTHSSSIEEFDPLHYACLRGSKKCVKMLLQNGADMSKRTKLSNLTAFSLILQRINKPTEFIEDIFDSCINTKICDYAIRIEYNILLPNEEPEQMKVVNALRSTGNRYDQKRLLRHPLIESFLYMKWKALLPYFYIIIILYGLFVTSFTILIMSVYTYKDNKEDTPSWLNTTIWSCIVYVALGLVVLLEIIYFMYNKSKTYFRHVEIWVKFSSILLGIVLAPALAIVQPDAEWLKHLSTVAVLLSWLEIMFLLSRFPKWGFYFMMFGNVAKKILKILLSFIFLLIAFSLGFMIQLNFVKPFDNIWSAVVKAMVMMNSEFDYEDLLEKKDSNEFAKIMLQLIFVVFLLLSAIVLMNLMVGIAVNDVHDLVMIGNIHRIEKQIDLLSSLESLVYVYSNIFDRILPTCLNRILQKRGQIPTFLVLRFGDTYNDIILPSHIIDVIFAKAITIKTRLNDQVDAKAFKTQINDIYKATVLKTEHDKISSSVSLDTMKDRNKKNKKIFDEDSKCTGEQEKHNCILCNYF